METPKTDQALSLASTSQFHYQHAKKPMRQHANSQNSALNPHLITPVEYFFQNSTGRERSYTKQVVNYKFLSFIDIVLLSNHQFPHKHAPLRLHLHKIHTTWQRAHVKAPMPFCLQHLLAIDVQHPSPPDLCPVDLHCGLNLSRIGVERNEDIALIL